MDWNTFGAAVVEGVELNATMAAYASEHGNTQIQGMPARDARLALLCSLRSEQSDGVRCHLMAKYSAEHLCYCARALAVLLDASAAEVDERYFRRMLEFLRWGADEGIAFVASAIAERLDAGPVEYIADPYEEYGD